VGRYVEGSDRNQVTLLPECLDDYIAEDNPVRVQARRASGGRTRLAPSLRKTFSGRLDSRELAAGEGF